MELIDLGNRKVNNTPRFLRMRQAQKEISLAWSLQQRVRNARSGRGVENRWDVESEKLPNAQRGRLLWLHLASRLGLGKLLIVRECSSGMLGYIQK